VQQKGGENDMSESRRKRERVNILGPVLLIAIGGVLLLNTLGILEWSVWLTIVRLWPVLLIAAGLDLLLGRHSVWGSLLAAVLVIGVLAGALWLGTTDRAPGGAGLVAQSVQQPLEGATNAEVRLSPAVGRLEVAALPEAASLVQGTIYRGRNEEVEEIFKGGTRASYSLRAGEVSWAPFGTWAFDRRLWDVGLSPGALLDLQADMGAGEVILDLTGLQLERLRVNMGLGRTEVRLPATGRFEATMEGAIGETVIVIPDGLAVRIQGSTGLAVRRLPEGYRRDGDITTSPGFEDAENRVELRVNQAMGALTVRPAE
jgi:hypothetical protein